MEQLKEVILKDGKKIIECFNIQYKMLLDKI